MSGPLRYGQGVVALATHLPAAWTMLLNRVLGDRETGLHHARDFTYDGDRCHDRTGNVPRDLACLTNMETAIVRIREEFRHLSKAIRYYAPHPQAATDALSRPPPFSGKPERPG